MTPDDLAAAIVAESRPALIMAMPRSGTRSLRDFLQEHLLYRGAVLHEALCAGDIPDMAALITYRMWDTRYRDLVAGWPRFHYVRHPLRVIASAAAKWSRLEQRSFFISGYLRPLGMTVATVDPVIDFAKLLAAFNAAAELECGDRRVRCEDLPGPLHPSYVSPNRLSVSWDDLQRLVPRAAATLIDQAERYGYPAPGSDCSSYPG